MSTVTRRIELAVNTHLPIVKLLTIILVINSHPSWANSLPDFTELAKESSKAVVNISTIKKIEKSKSYPPNWKNNPHGFEQYEGPFGDFFRKFFEPKD